MFACAFKSFYLHCLLLILYLTTISENYTLINNKTKQWRRETLTNVFNWLISDNLILMDSKDLPIVKVGPAFAKDLIMMPLSMHFFNKYYLYTETFHLKL